MDIIQIETVKKSAQQKPVNFNILGKRKKSIRPQRIVSKQESVGLLKSDSSNLQQLGPWERCEAVRVSAEGHTRRGRGQVHGLLPESIGEHQELQLRVWWYWPAPAFRDAGAQDGLSNAVAWVPHRWPTRYAGSRHGLAPKRPSPERDTLEKDHNCYRQVLEPEALRRTYRRHDPKEEVNQNWSGNVCLIFIIIWK